MSLSLFLEPVNGDIYEDIKDPNSWAKNIIIHKSQLPKWQKKHMAIIGLTENRGTNTNKGCATAADEIRRKLYQLKKGTGVYNIVDLGNLINGETHKETCERLKQVCEELMDKEVIPIVIGGSHDLNLGMYEAYEKHGKLINIVNVDARIDMEDEEDADLSSSHINQVLRQKPNYLFSFNHLAYQSYLNNQAVLEVLEQLYFQATSVGQMRNDFTEVEPIVRNADMLSFDITAVKMTDAPGNFNAQPFGLTAEESSQICWFAGLSEKLSSIGFFEYNPDFDNRQQTASLIATMIWYFVEGYYHRIKLQDFESNAFVKYVVSALDNSSNMTFYKHKVSQKWWMEVPYPNEISDQQEKIVIPCSYKDYQIASKGEVPDRWLNTYAKLV